MLNSQQQEIVTYLTQAFDLTNKATEQLQRKDLELDTLINTVELLRKDVANLTSRLYAYKELERKFVQLKEMLKS